MKSLVLALNFPPDIGGIQVIVYEITKRLEGKNFVLCRYADGSEDFDKRLGFKVRRKRFSPAGRMFWGMAFRLNALLPCLYFYKDAKNIIKRGSVDVVHCTHISTALLGYIFKKLFGVPYIIYTYGQEVMPPFIRKGDPFVAAMMKKIMNNADEIYTMSHFTKVHLANWVKDPSKIKIIELGGADMNLFKPGKKDRQLIKKHGLQGKKVILTVTRFEEYKGIDFVIKSLRLVKKDIPEIAYLVVGGGEDEQRLRKIAAEEGMQDCVIFAGEIPHHELAKYYNLCDVFILNTRDCLKKGENCSKSGRAEGFGIVFLEANACKKPVIGGDSGGIPDAIVNGKTGLLVNPVEMGDISDAIIKLIRDKRLSRYLAENGYRRVIKKYNYDYVSKRISKDIKRLAG